MLQYRLWVSENSIAKMHSYQYQLQILQQQIDSKQKRNKQLAIEVDDLRLEAEAVEEIARYDLGMIKKNETFFQVFK